MRHLHSRGVIHRDLKPGNVFLNGSFEPSVGGFGISRVADSLLSGGQGTRLYMAPEVIDGKIGRITQMCDVFSSGVFLQQMAAADINLKMDRLGVHWI
jgi:serine/threonine protein kinase